MNRMAPTIAVVALVGMALGGIIHGTRATLAQLLYRRAKYGSSREPHAILSDCHRAEQLYPWNYNFCAFASEQAYYAGSRAEGDERLMLLGASRHWCDEGLGLNPYPAELNLLRVRLLAMSSVREALAHQPAATCSTE